MKKPTLSLADAPDVLTPLDVRRILGISRNATYALLRSGRLHSVRVSRRILIPKQQLVAFLGLASGVQQHKAG